MPRIIMPPTFILGFRLEVLSCKTMEWMTVYEGVGKAYIAAIHEAAFVQAIKEPEVLEVRLVKTHSLEVPFGSPEVDKVPALEEPVVIQHVRLRWRLGR